MKKILTSTLLLTSLAFSYELNFGKSFSTTVNSDTLSSDITISVEKKDEKSINIEIEKFNNFLKNTKDITIENTNYNLTPKYDYVNNKSIFKGYVGNSSFSVKSKEASKINSFLNDLIALKENIKSDDLKLDIGNLSWEISNILQNKTIDELRLESLFWVENYAKELSSKVAKRCEIKNININEEHSNYMPKYRNLAMSMDSVAASAPMSDIAPMKTEQNIKINTNFVLDCK